MAVCVILHIDGIRNTTVKPDLRFTQKIQLTFFYYLYCISQEREQRTIYIFLLHVVLFIHLDGFGVSLFQP